MGAALAACRRIDPVPQRPDRSPILSAGGGTAGVEEGEIHAGADGRCGTHAGGPFLVKGESSGNGHRRPDRVTGARGKSPGQVIVDEGEVVTVLPL